MSVNVRVGDAVGIAHLDRMLLKLTVKNILENAILHAPADSHVDLVVEQEAEELRIDVIDPGLGMTPAEAKHLMGRFNRGSREGEGTGLGLAIVEMATHKLGAQLAFEQRKDGFCARISLPISRI